MQPNRALITGIHGFCGRHLAVHLAQHGYAVSGIDLAAGAIAPGIEIYTGDVRDRDFVQAVLAEVRPSHIFHLAALVAPGAGLEALYEVNVLGTGRLLDTVQELDIDPAILIAGSSAAYGLVEADGLPIGEAQPFHPLDAYAVSKIAQEMIAYTYYARHHLKVIRTRTFNLIGPGQPPTLAASAFARQIAEMETGSIEPVLRVGNLTPERDFLDVRDGVRAYQMVMQSGQPGLVYNVCSGQAISIQTCLDELLNLSTVPMRVEKDPARMRRSDIPVSVGDGSLLYRTTGWQPEIPLKQSLADLLDDWRRRTQEVW